MYIRRIYLDRIRPFLAKPVVKVITGMRRVGKSCLLRQIIDMLRETGVAADNILYIDKESLEFETIRTHQDLHATAMARLGPQEGMKYLLVDEVQEITDWERAIAALSGKPDFDIVVTGSNASLFSSELATLLSGRYIELPVFSLGFSEHLFFRSQARGDTRDEFARYLRYGGMPAIHHFGWQEDVVYQYVGSVYSTILLKDIVKRHGVRNVQLLESIARYLCDNIGNTMSAKSIADYLKSQRLKIGVDTVQRHLAYFVEALVAHRVQRYDLKGKRLLEIHDKYYLGDLGIRHSLLGYRESDMDGMLENLVYLELLRRGYGVHVGKFDEREVDFVATRQGERIYIQVAYLLASSETIDRELGVLLDIPDNYPKLVLSMDTLSPHDIEGVQRLNVVDFLLGQEMTLGDGTPSGSLRGNGRPEPLRVNGSG